MQLCMENAERAHKNFPQKWAWPRSRDPYNFCQYGRLSQRQLGFLFFTLKLVTNTFTVKQLHICHVIQYNIIKIVHFWLKYNGLAIVRRATKLIEGGHRGLQESIIIYVITFTFFTFFYVFFQNPNPKSRDFLRFCHVSYVFSNYVFHRA